MLTITFITCCTSMAVYFNTAAVMVVAKSDTGKANSYLIEMWREWYAANDFNHDGVLTMDDIKLYKKFYKDIDNMSEEQFKNIEERMDRIWKTVVLNDTAEISKEGFVEMLKQKYESNQTAFTEMIRDYITSWCETMDLNGDNFISEEEFLNDMFASQHNDTAKNEFYFYAFRPVNGSFPVGRIINYFIHFATAKYALRSDIFMKGLDASL